MTHITAYPFEAGASPPNNPPVKPPWLRPTAVAGVVAFHAIVAWLLMAAAIEHLPLTSLDSVGLDLVPKGDFFESQEIAPAEEEPPPPEEAEQPDLAIPPPTIMAPESPPLPVKKKEIAQPKSRVVETKPTADYAKQRREAQAGRRLGSPEGGSHATGMSRASYAGLLAAAIRRHTPASSSAGPGTAHVTFHVTVGGGISGVSASGSTPAHASLARRIIMSVHAPPPPGGAFFASQSFSFH